jgi:hypothetical protein
MTERPVVGRSSLVVGRWLITLCEQWMREPSLRYLDRVEWTLMSACRQWIRLPTRTGVSAPHEMTTALLA